MITSNIQNIQSIHQLAQVAQEAEKMGAEVVYVGGNSVRVVKHSSLENVASSLSGQHNREAARLDKFAASLLEAEYKARGMPLLDRSTRINSLVGKTIDAHVASSFLTKIHKDNAPVVEFDGTGKIKHIREEPKLRELELFRLESAIVQDLRASNAQGERTAARTESECVLEALGLLKNAQAQQPDTPDGNVAVVTLYELQQPLQNLWLSGQMNQAGAKAALLSAADAVRAAHPELSDKLSQLAQEVSKDKALTQRHDNTFGRMFESTVGKQLAEKPSAKMLQTASAINAFLLNHMLTPQKNYTIEQNIEGLAKALKKDVRPWHAEVPQVQDFLSQPNADTLRNLLTQPTSNGYQMMMTYWMAAKVSSDVSGPWMQAASENYNNLIKPARSSEFTPLSEYGVENAAHGAIIGNKLLDNMEKVLERPSAAQTLGMSKDELQALRDSVRNLVIEMSKASGTYVLNDQLLPANRDALLSTLQQAADLAADKFPEEAQGFLQLHEQVSASETLETGSKGGARVMAGASNTMTNQYGTGLVHQPKNEVPDNWKMGVNIPAKTGVNVNVPTPFEKGTLERNQNTVNGVSGTTNMLTFMLLHMKENGVLNFPNGEPMDMGDALAGNLTFLLMDGGHSIPEAMATSTSILANPKYFSGEEFMHLSTPENRNGANNARKAAQEEIRLERQQVLDNYITNYAELGQQLGSPDTGAIVAQAVSAAFEQTRNSFDRLHLERTV